MSPCLHLKCTHCHGDVAVRVAGMVVIPKAKGLGASAAHGAHASGPEPWPPAAVPAPLPPAAVPAPWPPAAVPDAALRPPPPPKRKSPLQRKLPVPPTRAPPPHMLNLVPKKMPMPRPGPLTPPGSFAEAAHADGGAEEEPAEATRASRGSRGSIGQEERLAEAAIEDAKAAEIHEKYLASDARRCASRRVRAAEEAAANALLSAESAEEEEEHLPAEAEAADATWAAQADRWAVDYDADYYRAGYRADDRAKRQRK